MRLDPHIRNVGRSFNEGSEDEDGAASASIKSFPRPKSTTFKKLITQEKNRSATKEQILQSITKRIQSKNKIQSNQKRLMKMTNYKRKKTRTIIYLDQKTESFECFYKGKQVCRRCDKPEDNIHI